MAQENFDSIMKQGSLKGSQVDDSTFMGDYDIEHDINQTRKNTGVPNPAPKPKSPMATRINEGRSMIGLQSYEHDLCLQSQIYGIGFFYVINVITDILLYFLGEEAIGAGGLDCRKR